MRGKYLFQKLCNVFSMRLARDVLFLNLFTHLNPLIIIVFFLFIIIIFVFTPAHLFNCSGETRYNSRNITDASGIGGRRK